MGIRKSLEKISVIATGLVIGSALYASSVFAQGIINTKEKMPKLPENQVSEAKLGKHTTVKVFKESKGKFWLAYYVYCGDSQDTPYLLASITPGKVKDYLDIDRNGYLDNKQGLAMEGHRNLLKKCK